MKLRLRGSKPTCSWQPTPYRKFTSTGVVLALAIPALLIGGCGESADPALTSATRVADHGPFDLVLTGGRVIDPESGFDQVADVGIRDGVIRAVTAESLADAVQEGGEVIDTSGLVVAPGFIDLHAHGQSKEANAFQARDGVTTALELEWGYPRLSSWIASRADNARIHYGASVAHGMVRTLVMPELAEEAEALEESLRQASTEAEPLRALQGTLSRGFYLPVAPEQFDAVEAELNRGLAEGALGIGMAHQYYPGATRGEIYRVFEVAALKDAPIYTHVRSMGLDAMQEVVANAAATGAPLHIVHVNSSSLGDLPLVLELIRGAREHGVDVTTESYPYTAGSTSIQSSIFDEGWRERLDIDYGDLQWEATSERLTADTFARYRARGGTVIIHMMKDELVDLAVATPWVIVGSDGMPYAPGAHPRGAGTFSRVLGRYVRERGVLDLPTALAKMTILPAKRLESIAPQMARKGRVQAGADADLVVFDPETIIDTATFEGDLSPSEGVEHTLVLGTFVVRDGQLVESAFPGQAITGRYLGEGPVE